MSNTNRVDVAPAAQQLTYFKGDAAVYTGRAQELYGATFYEIRLIEGHLKGELKVTRTAPKS